MSKGLMDNEVIIVIKKIFLKISKFMSQLILSNGNCSQIPPHVLKNVKLKHCAIGTVVNSSAKVGKNVILCQNVTIGSMSVGGKIKKGHPVIEDYVQIRANSVIFGGITVGHHSVIGAGAVVYKDVPPYSLVVGNCKIYEGKYKNISEEERNIVYKRLELQD